MLDENTRAIIGDNAAPSPMETCAAEWDATISEAQNWSDGDLVENEAQMQAVDSLIKGVKSYRSALKKAGDGITQPLVAAHKAGVAAVKVWTEDADALQACLVKAVGPFKLNLAVEKKAAERDAWLATERLRKAATTREHAASLSSDIELQREAQDAKQAALDAEEAAMAATKDKPTGLRTVTHYAVEDGKQAINWIAKNDREAITSFIEEYARRNHKKGDIAGVNVWTTKEAF